MARLGFNSFKWCERCDEKFTPKKKYSKLCDNCRIKAYQHKLLKAKV